jgi:DNA-binding SARP family transcriptional activator
MWVEVKAFEEAAANARRARDPIACRVAVDLYSGDLLPEDRYEERGECGPTIEALQRALSEEPTNEEVHAGPMRLYALSGRQGEALAQYERLQETSPGSSVRSNVGQGARGARVGGALQDFQDSEPVLITADDRFLGESQEELDVTGFRAPQQPDRLIV